MRMPRPGRGRTQGGPHATALPEALTRFVSGARADDPVRPPMPWRSGWAVAPLLDIGLALGLALVVALAGGQILQAW
jgi:hypothetical protein